ncbi:MAG TPA: histidine--tRNA ligase [Flavobacteriales bacterium]|nr:histidine--tRNA ligase [Flavobacteriales bacterium]
MATKPSIPKGTRDFGPVEMLRRKYIFSTIEQVFQKYGYLPLETPAMENLETLTGKYGEEGDRLIFKILKRGADLDRAVQDGSKSLAAEALRYDLTVPFARYVVQNQNEIAFPFKRYQIQPVWRADRPQKGRYREFYQCDADVIGSTSLLSEVELVQLFDDVFTALGLKVVVKINDRKVLSGIAEVCGQPEKVVDIVTAIDKLDKIGREKVEEEMRAKGVSDEAITGIAPLFALKGTWSEQRVMLEKWLAASSIAQKGLKDLSFTFDAVGALKSAMLQFDPTLARGLDYYTGAIFEVKAAEGTLQSSICGGGRYDDLTGVFGLKGMSGVGISFGADRIYDVLLETNKFPAELGSSTRLLFANFGEQEALHCLKLLRQVREAGIAAELYPDQAKLPKQFTYAEKKGIPFVVIVGENEMNEGVVTLKKMGAQEKGRAMPIAEMIALLKDQS